MPKLNQRGSDEPVVRRIGQPSEIAEFYSLGIRVLAFADKHDLNVAAAARAIAEKEQGVGFDRAEKASAFARLYRRPPLTGCSN